MPELSEKQSLQLWNEYVENIRKSTALFTGETEEQQRKRIKILEADAELWFKYYFPQYCYAEPAAFHKAATKRVLNNLEWYEVRMWSRELSKSVRTMMETMYLCLTGKKKYVLMISNSYDNAERLLKPYKGNLEANQRIINDYGAQELPGEWSSGEFTTRKSVAFRALGAGQSPRGTRNEEARPDVLLFDDIDTDEECRNPVIIKNKWRWIEEAAIGTRSISKQTTIIFCGNRIAKDCCVERASKYADEGAFTEINIRDKNGLSTWPQKNTEEFVDRVLSQKSYISAQKEYFNNPISEGSIFKEMHYKRMPALSAYKFLVCYIDLSYKASTRNDFKAAVLMGKIKDEYHIRKCWLKQGTTMELAKGLIDIQNYVGGKTALYFYAEENFLQDIILKDLHEIFESLKANISVSPDTRKKPDKFHRIESTLEPLNTNSKLYLNEDEKSNHHMQVLDEQFRALEPGTKTHDDGPDASEGAKHMIDTKSYEDVDKWLIGKRNRNAYAY